jgi:hypothetical protein
MELLYLLFTFQYTAAIGRYFRNRPQFAPAPRWVKPRLGNARNHAVQFRDFVAPNRPELCKLQIYH